MDMFKKCLLNIFAIDEDFKTDTVSFALGEVFYMEMLYDKALFFFSLNYRNGCLNKDQSLYFIAKIYVKIKSYSKALLTIQKYTTLKPADPKGFYLSGKINYMMKDFKQSLKLFELVL